jgi:molybdenum cofactor cytidylyltransferase
VAADAVGVVAVVLAAGASSRFGSPKALADLGGRPLLQHVLDTLAAAGLVRVVVVLGAAATAVEEAISWRTEHRVRNPHPEAGLASSLKVGLEALPAGTRAALVVLGDQPMLRAEVIHAVLAAGIAGGRPITVPRYAAGGALNPVLLARPAWELAAALKGDRGMGPLIHASPDLVTNVPVTGDNPDVDTPADLARLAEATDPGPATAGIASAEDLAEAWAERVRANRAQVDRFREVPDGRDFYRPTSSLFRADPSRTGDAVLAALLALARPDDTWLDIGAGAGRYALPLARRVREVIALDPSAAMLDGLREGLREHAIANVRVLQGRWPADAGDLLADAALIAHVGYDVEEIAPFLAAMERAARGLCVAVLMAQAPAAAASPFWPEIHGEARVPLPALDDLLALLRAQGRSPRVDRIAGQPRRWATDDEALGFLRQQLWVSPDGPKGTRLASIVRALPHEADGSIEIGGADREIGVVTWKPAEVARRTVH